jgi:hypothetical protein
VDFNFLREFLQEEVAKQYLPAERCMLLDRFLRMFQHTFASSAQQGSQEGLVNAMELLVIPMLEDTLAQPFAREVRRTASHALRTLSLYLLLLLFRSPNRGFISQRALNPCGDLTYR